MHSNPIHACIFLLNAIDHTNAPPINACWAAVAVSQTKPERPARLYHNAAPMMGMYASEPKQFFKSINAVPPRVESSLPMRCGFRSKNFEMQV